MAISLFGVLVLLAAIAVPLVIGIALIVKSRGKGLGYPACGSCKYDVSASVGNTDRCPECGVQFVTAGILPPRGHRQPAMMWMGIALVLLTVSCAGASVFSMVLSQRSMTRARATALQRQQALQTQQLQQQQQQDGGQAIDGDAVEGSQANSPPPASE